MYNELNYNRTYCESCEGKNLTTIFDFGEIPLAGRFLNATDDVEKYPLSILKCENCSLVQTSYIIDEDILFKDYRYISSISMQKHFNSFADWLVENKYATKESEVLEFGCNDGPLLFALKEKGVNATGVDPAENITRLGVAKGLDIWTEYFDDTFILKRGFENKFDLILSSNSFAHITDIKDVVQGVRDGLKPDGKFIFEVQYFKDLVDKVQFDFLYHEHLYYYTLTSLKYLLEQFDLTILDFERIPIHSGSIRVVAGKGEMSAKVKEQIEKEKSIDLEDFEDKVVSSLVSFKTFLDNNKDKYICGYGASGRANVVTSLLDLEQDSIKYIVDESPERMLRWTSNGNIPIFPPSALIQQPPDFIIIFAWNFADMIIDKTKLLVVKYVIPFPELQIIG